MAWVHDGKIACQSQNGNNFDVNKIIYIDSNHTYTQDGDESCSVNSVYYIPAGVTPTQSNLINYRIWHRYWQNEPVVRSLANDTNGGFLLIKYEAGLSDEAVSSISVFTSTNNDNGRCVFILDNDGILIGKSNATETKVADTTIHGLTAIKRTTTFSPTVTLKAGQIYWIQYYFENMDSDPDAYYTETGVVGAEYKKIALNNYSSNIPVDMSTMNYVGKLFDSNTSHADIVSTILQLNQNDVFVPNKTSQWPIQGMTINNFYMRNGNYLNKFAKQVDHTSFTDNKNQPTINEIKNMTAGKLIVVGYTEHDSDVVYVWEKTSTGVPSSITDYNISTAEEIANWMVAMNVTGKACTFSGTGNWPHPYTPPDRNGSTIYVRTSNGSIAFSSASDVITEVPSSPVQGRIYLKANGADFPGSTQWTNGPTMVVYLGNNSWADLTILDKEFTLSDSTKIQFFTKNTISTYATDVTSSVWADNSPNIFSALNPQPTMIDISTTTFNDKRHYLEINGNEVF